MATQKDPTTFGYQNFYSTTLTGDITSGTLTIGLATVPSPSSGILVIEPNSTSAREVVFYTSKGASTITCPSDGRGWSGSTASAHLTGSTVVMVSVDEYFEGLADGTLSTDPLRTIICPNHVVSGGVVAQSAGLVGTFSNIVFYINGQRYSGTSIANKTYTASKDTYVDVTAASGGAVTVAYNEVVNGAAAPALAANYIRVAKVVTSGAAITIVTQTGFDSLFNAIYPNSPLFQTGAWITPTLTNSWVNFGGSYENAGYMKDSLGFVHLKGLVKSGVASQSIFTLPVGYRPLNTRYMSTVGGGTIATIDINASGAVIPNGTGIASSCSLECITFRAES